MRSHTDTPSLKRSTISPIPRFFASSDSLDYANHWRSPHAEPPSHSDRKSCSTRREMSSPAKELSITFRTGVVIAYVITIRNRHSETVDRALVSRNSVPGPKYTPERPTIFSFQRFSGNNVSLDYVNLWRGNHTESACHDDRKLCSTLRENPSPGIGIAYVTTIQNRHSEMVVKTPVLRNSKFGGRNATVERVY
ncbi:hypothetical protein Taro_052661 [Colocasia esculenta]|uniref:Uncharacterized protein n=1 Tax=Colocasia esculenta TaxID=4460 RepID=A0A843XKE3_COLES|nr:hypothetical protein [Colocasia esculenta]